MKLLLGLKVPNRNNLLCHLNRSIYSLKQASRQWNQKLTNTLINLGYTQSKSDYSLFTNKNDNCFTAVWVYVDNLLIADTHMDIISNLKHVLNTKFNI